jgi:hypothetical protein
MVFLRLLIVILILILISKLEILPFLLSGFAYYEYFAVDSIPPDLPAPISALAFGISTLRSPALLGRRTGSLQPSAFTLSPSLTTI